MEPHFSRAEFQARTQRVLAAVRAAGLDGLLCFNQASRYYLTGYDSFGFVLFECLYVRADGKMVLLTRPTDVPAARHTSNIEDVRVWRDGEDPVAHLRGIVAKLGGPRPQIGVEYESFGLTGRNALKLNAAMDGLCTLVDASELVAKVRVVKSAAELAYIKQAAHLADTAHAEARRLARPRAFEGEILAAMQGVIFRGGGDYPGNEFTIASGAGALLPRYFSGRRRLDAQDQLVLQIGGAYRRYHAALMDTFIIGRADDRHRAMHRAVRESLDRAHAMLKPGVPLASIYKEYADIVGRAGFGDATLSAIGYSLGAAYHPTWMDFPWIHPGSEMCAEPDMVFYLHMVLIDQATGYAMSIGNTCVVTDQGNERLSKVALDLTVL